MSSNVQRLANTLSGRMTKTARNAVPVTLELGTINADMSLTTDTLSGNISQRDYMIDIQLSHANYYSYTELNSSVNAPHHHEGGGHSQTGGSGEHTHDDGLHDHRAPAVFRRLQPGDRVLVAWVGNDPIIIAIVVSGDTITQN